MARITRSAIRRNVAQRSRRQLPHLRRWPKPRAAPSTSSRRPAPTIGSSSSRPRGKRTCCPYFRLLTSQAGPVVEMEGRETIMLGSNNYLGLTTDERVKQAARDALEAYGTGLTGSRLLNGTTPLHVELERELAEWMQTEEALVFTTGYQSNVGCIGTILEPGDTVVCDSGDHASILDGCRLSGAKLRPVPPQPHGQAGADAGACRRGRRRRAGDRRRRLLDGGGRLRPAADRRALPALRRPPDGRRGPRRRRPRRARGGRLRAVRPRGRRWTCGWAPSRRAWPPAAASSPAPRR